MSALYDKPWVVYSRVREAIHSRHESRERAMQVLIILSDELFSAGNSLGYTYKHIDDMDERLLKSLGIDMADTVAVERET